MTALTLAFALAAFVPASAAPAASTASTADPGEPVAHAPGVRSHWAVTEDSVRVWYETEGEGVPIVLVPGGPGGTHHSFHLTHRSLARHGRIVYVDNRGRGRSDPGHGAAPYSLVNDVRDVEAVRRALGAERIVIYGRSYGGMVAQAYAIAHPERVRALIVSNSLDGAGAWQASNIDGVKRFLAAHYPDRWDAIVRLHGQGFLTSQDTLATLFSPLSELYNFSPASDSLFRLQTRPFRDPERPSHSSVVYEAMVGKDPEWILDGTLTGVELVPSLRALDVPALVLAGRYDRITPPDVQRTIARAIPNARLHVFEKSGHRPEFEEAEQWRNVVGRFLEETLADRARKTSAD